MQQNISRRRGGVSQRRLAMATFAAGMFVSGIAEAQTTWTGGSGTNFTTGANWVGGSNPGSGSTSDLHFYNTNGNYTANNDYGGYTAWRDILFNAGGAFSLTSNAGNSINLYRKIENNGTFGATVNFDNIALSATAEMNPVNGDLTVNAPNIYTNGFQLNVWGSNGKTLTFGGTTIISQAGNFSLNAASNVVFQSAHTYTGSTFVNAGTLQVDSGGSAANSIIRIGDTSGSQASNLVFNTVNQTYGNTIEFRAGSSGVRTLYAVGNTTLSSTVTVSENAAFSVSDGTLRLNVAIPVTNKSITKSGAGSLYLASTPLHTGGTVANAGIISVPQSTSLSSSAGAALSGAVAGIFQVRSNSATNTQTIDLDLVNFNGTLAFGNGNIRWGSSSSLPSSAILTGGKNATFDLGVGTLYYRNGTNGAVTFEIGALAGNSASTIAGGGSSGSGVINFQIGNKNVDTAYPGTIKDGSTKSAITKVGTAKLTLSGTNTYSGNTVISNGRIVAGSSGAIPGGSGKGNVVLDAGATVAGTFDINGFDVTINGLSGTSGTVLGQVVNDAVSTTRTLTVGSGDATTTYSGKIADNTGTGGTLALTKSGSGVLTLSGTNTYTGITTVNGGTLAFSSPARLPGTKVFTVANGAAMSLGAGADATITSITFSGNGIASFSSSLNANSVEELSVDTFEVESLTTGVMTHNGRTALSNATGTGTLVLNVPARISQSRYYLKSNWSSYAGTINLVGTSATSGLSLQQNGGGFTNLGNAHVDISSSLPGTNTMALQGRFFTDSSIAIGALSGSTDAILRPDSDGGAGTFVIGSLNRTTTFAGMITDNSDVLGIEKVGSATLTLSNSNSYSGPTKVTAGTLVINGAHSGTGQVLVNGGTLGGSGSVAGAVSLAAGATMAPGSSAGQFTINNSFSLAESTAATLEIELGSNANPGVTFDQLLVTGTVTVKGARLNVIPLPGAAAGMNYVIVAASNYNNNSNTNYFAQLNDQLASHSYTANSGFKYTLTYTDGVGISLHIDAVPEPSSLALLAGAGVLGLRRRR